MEVQPGTWQAALAGDGDRVLGASTADQVLERWHAFLEDSARVLRNHVGHPGAWHRLPPEAPPAFSQASANAAAMTALSESALQDLAGTLGLGDSAAATVVNALGGTIAQARACVAAAPELFRPLAFFGDALASGSVDVDSTQTHPGLLVEFAELLPTLRNIRKLLDRIAAVAAHLLRQLIGLHATSAAAHSVLAKRLPLRPVLDALGELLVVPVVIDGLLLESSRIRRAHTSYKWIASKAAAAAGQDSSQLGAAGAALPEMSAATAAGLSAELAEAEPLMHGDAFQLVLAKVRSILADNLSGDSATSVAALLDQGTGYFQTRLKESETAGATAVAQLWLPAESLVPWVCAFVLFASVWKPQKGDARLVADVWKMHKRSPVVFLFGKVAWCVGEFLQTHLPALITDSTLKKELEDMKNIRQKQAARLDDGSFTQEMHRNRFAVQAWLAGLGATAKALGTGNVSRALKDAQSALLRGLALALRVRASLEEYLMLHVREGVPMPRSCLQAVSLGFQLLKAIEAGPSAPRWAELSILLQRNLALRLHTELESARTALKGRDQQATHAIDVATAALYRIIRCTATEQLDTYLDRGALAICCTGRVDISSSGAGTRWREFGIACRWRQQLARLCDTSWTYWVREYYPELLNDIRQRPRGAPGLPLLCRAFAAPLDGVLPSGSALSRMYLKQIRESLEASIITPLCQSIEQDLRLHTHAVMQSVLDSLPRSGNQEVLGLLALRPLTIAPQVVVDIRDQVELRLSKTFYDLNALAPQDAEAYDRMRSLARERYGISPMDGLLPGGSLDHGLDVIEIMRNIHLLATQYSYSLHQQLFFQASNQGDTKIRSIAVEHLAASIRTHGAGIINTTVNYTYGFLKRKLEVVVEFLADETVRSRLLADRQWMEDQRAGQRGYTWARAMETAKFIRRLGADKNGVSFLDKMRQVVTQIGNSLGFVRMVRTAGMRYVARSLPYISEAAGPEKERNDAPRDEDDPEDEDALSGEPGKKGFLRSAEAAECPPLVLEAARTADDAMRTVTRCFESSTDHLNLLANVFSKALVNSRSGSIPPGGVLPRQLFYLLVPALALSFLDGLLVGREALAKRATAASSSLKSNALCFDDGFAVGVACVLRIFGLEREFQALHWFETQISDGDIASGQARQAAGGAPFAESKGQGTRRDQLEKEMQRLAASLEAASSLFGSSDDGQGGAADGTGTAAAAA